MAKLKLSVAALERLRKTPPQQRTEHRVENFDGLLLRIPPKPGGKRVWRATFWLRFRFEGRRHTHKLSQFPLETDREVLQAAIDTARTQTRNMLAELAAGRNPLAASRELTFGKYVEDYYGPWVQQRHKDPEGTLRRLMLFGFDDIPLADLRLGHVEAWRTAELAAGRKPSTVNRKANILRAALARAVDWELLDEHPLRRLKPLKVDRQGVVRFLAPDEESRLMHALKERDDRKREERQSANVWRQQRGYELLPELGSYADNLTPIVVLALHTGCRRGELWNLVWGDVDLKARRLTVKGSGAKTQQTRHIPLNATAIDVLKTHQGDATPMPHVAVFGDAEFKNAWTAVLKKADITNFRFHDLRHTFASRLVQNGVDLAVVRELMGHSDMTMTLRYAHLANRQLTDAVDRIG